MRGGLLVTGAGGRLGRTLGRLVPDAALLSRAACDVTDETAVREAIARIQPKVVVHAAAWTNVDGAEAQPEAARAVNMRATQTLARACAESDALLVYPSTDYVFGRTSPRPLREDDPVAPLSVYGRSKAEGEDAAREAPNHLVVRTSWLFGEGNNFVRSVIERAREDAELGVVSDQIGLPTAVADLAAGIMALVDAGARGTFHLAGSGDPCSRADLARESIEAAVGEGILPGAPRIRDIRTEEAGDAALRPRYSVLDCSKAASSGVRLRPWRDALAAYVGELARSSRKSA